MSLSRRHPAALGLAVFALALACAHVRAGDLGRSDEPVVLRGADLAPLDGVDPARIVGYVYDAGWHRIALQVDERHVTDFGTVYGGDPGGTTFLTYSDPGTYSGPDPDTAFDADDELVFLAGDAGAEAAPGIASPSGTSPDTRIEIALRDPSSGVRSHVYLFVATGEVAPVRTPHPITYDFVLLSGSYKTTYDFDGCNDPAGCNPEDSSITTAHYRVGFSDRWIRDETDFVDDAGTIGFDRIDRHKNLFAPGQCQRSELTFSRGRGAFLVNRAGPVRALRGYVGANSGPTTYRIHAFYPRREVILTVLRVHPIPGIVDFFDYAPGHGAMTYFNDLEPGGVPVDGVPDAVEIGELAWEAIRWDEEGGAAAHVVRVDTDIPDLVKSSFYSDNATPLYTQCTGDDVEHGASGFRTFDIPNTDDSGGAFANRFRATRTIRWNHAADPVDGTSDARELAMSVDHPIEVTIQDQSGGAGPLCTDADGDGFVDCDRSCSPSPEAPCGDCDDADPDVRPDVDEVCGDGVDNDCDGAIDNDGVGATTWYADADGDGFGDAGDPVSACEQPDGAVADDSDCDDDDPAVHPGATEICDDRDGDCDTIADDVDCPTYDWSGDGRIDAAELVSLGRAFGACRDEDRWFADADLDGNGCVDGDDLAALARVWARTCDGLGGLSCD